jgi:uncharacterized protein YaaQ
VKMIIAILRDSDADTVISELTAGSYRVTRIASTGGLLRSGITTLLLGVKDERVESAIQLIREKTSPATGDEKRYTLFVVPVEKFEQL